MAIEMSLFLSKYAGSSPAGPIAGPQRIRVGRVTGLILESVEGGVGTITLNRPEKLNALLNEMLEGLLTATCRMRDDPDVRCVVLTGAGAAFCAGGDVEAVINEARADANLHPRLRRRPQTATAKVDRMIRLQQAAAILHDMPKPTIAMINGPCMGAGFSLAGACDLRFAADSAVLSSAFARADVPGDYGGTYFWSKISGSAKAREIYLLCERIAAEDALTQGLVTRVFPDATLQEETMAIARNLVRRAPHVQALMKRNLNLAEHSSVYDALRMEAINMTLASYDNLELSRLAKDADRFADQAPEAATRAE